MSTSRRLPSSGGGAVHFTPAGGSLPPQGRSPTTPGHRSSLCRGAVGSAGGANAASPPARPPAAGAARTRYAVASAHSARGKQTCPWTARARFLGGGCRCQACWRSLIPQCSMRRRSSSGSKMFHGWATPSLVSNTPVPPGPSSRWCHVRPTTAWSGSPAQSW